MRFHILASSILSVVFPALAGTLTTAAQVYDATFTLPRTGLTFRVTGTVAYGLSADRTFFGIRDATGSARIHFEARPPDTRRPRSGDRVTVSGTLRAFGGYVHAVCENLETVACGPPPPPTDVRIADLYAGRHDFDRVRVSGILCDVFRDELDPRYVFYVINDGSASVSVTHRTEASAMPVPTKLVGRQATITGICASGGDNAGTSRQLGQTIIIDSPDAIHLGEGSPADRFDAPDLPERLAWNPLERNALKRGKASGYVLAVWQNRRFLIRTPQGRLSRVELLEGPPPRFGESVEAAGFLETDLLLVNISRAVWRPAVHPVPFRPEPPETIALAGLLSDGKGNAHVISRYNGKTLRVTGNVRRHAGYGADDARFLLEADGWSLTVDASSLPDLPGRMRDGCRVEVTGICITDTETWHPNAPFPHAKSNFLVLRSPSDIRVLSDPPWWTPARLFVATGILALLLIGVSVWNVTLNRLAERRGNALANERLALVESELKIRERTRLAVELHDSVSQVLTGVSMEINAAKRLVRTDAERTAGHLLFASKSLTSCRDELRNCMWDLRNLTLDETDINDAIRRTLKPHLGKTKLAVRFNVPRERLSDNTAHAFLRIIRELSVNSVRHGHATEIQVAGAIEGEHLLFSVTDDGTGFDPERSPGPDEGHFGLQGIRERVKAFGGTFDIMRAVSGGTRAVITIHIPSGKRT